MIILAYHGGLLTIASPCILPVLPFVFARSDQPFIRTGLPLLTGKAPGKMHGTDIDAAGNGTVTEQQLYQLIRQSDGSGEYTFSIEFADAGVNAYAFTSG